MAIAYKSQGAGAATETSGAACSPASPATVDAGDILIIHAYFEGTTTAPNTPTGFTLLSGPHTIETTIARMWIYGKIADGTEDGAANALGSQAVTTMRAGRCYSFSGRVSGTIGNLVRGFAFLSHATDPQMPTVTTTYPGSLAVACVGQNDNNTAASATGESGGDWVEAVAEFTSALTPGLMLQIQTCTPTSDPGTVSGGSVATTNDPCGVIGFEIRPEVDVYPTSIGSAEAFGSTNVDLVIGATSIASAEAFGTANVEHRIDPSGIASLEALGTANVEHRVDPSSIASLEAFGTAVVELAADQTFVDPTAITSAEAFGTTQLNHTIDGTGIASAEAFGTLVTALTLDPSSITSLEAFGTTNVVEVVAPTSITSLEAFGTALLSMDVLPTGIASAEAFGTLVTALTLNPLAIATAEAFGTPEVAPVTLVSPTAVTSLEAFGTAQLDHTLYPPSIASAEAFGTTVLSTAVVPTSITSLEAFGTADIDEVTLITANAIASAEAFGSPQLDHQLYPSAIASLEAFGTAALRMDIVATSIASTEAFGTAYVAPAIGPTSIASQEAVSSPVVSFTITPAGITSLEAFGTTQFVAPDGAPETQGVPAFVVGKLGTVLRWTDIEAAAGMTVKAAVLYQPDGSQRHVDVTFVPARGQLFYVVKLGDLRLPGRYVLSVTCTQVAGGEHVSVVTFLAYA